VLLQCLARCLREKQDTHQLAQWIRWVSQNSNSHGNRWMSEFPSGSLQNYTARLGRNSFASSGPPWGRPALMRKEPCCNYSTFTTVTDTLPSL
jgi:hypothetical protein